MIVLLACMFFSCGKGNMNVCIELNKTVARVGDLIKVTNCGDDLPGGIDVELDWGDGTSRTDGATGDHTYVTAGAYTIKLYVNGNPASDRIEEDKVEKKITINK